MRRATRGGKIFHIIRWQSECPSRTSQQLQSTPLAVPVAGTQVSKQAHLIAMLQSEPGATMRKMRSLTGWQAHAVRGAISGALRKRLGLNVVCNAMAAFFDRVAPQVS